MRSRKSSASSDSTRPSTSTRNSRSHGVSDTRLERAPVLASGAPHHLPSALRRPGVIELQGDRVRVRRDITFPHGQARARQRYSGCANRRRRRPPGGSSAVWNRCAGGGGASSRFICGFLACDPQLSGAFLGGLPPLIKVNVREDPSGQWLENSLKFSVAQAANREAGASAMLTKLSEVLFAETLRRYIRGLPEGQTGWLASARDVEVGKALTLIHHRHAHPWTVAELAREAGLSRTVLSERFRHFLGESPMAYVMRWRLQLGARALTATSHSVAQIASEVGYESEAAFNRAFKREYGLPPATYRRDKARR